MHKLVTELDQPITSERQVVYILVELRKLLEREGALKDNRYRSLKVCCDWTVHSKLDQRLANEITELFDQYEARYRREPVGVSQANMPELVEFCDHTRFRAQFIAACDSFGIPTANAEDDQWWNSFLQQFSEVIRDCPLEANPNKTTYVTRVTASAIDPASIGIVNRQFAISWVWERKDIDVPGHVVSLF